MTTTQLILYGLIALVVVLYIRRKVQLRGVVVYSPQEALERMRQPGMAILLDVRSAAERAQNNIKGSIHIPLHELGRRVDELEKYRNREVICYCQSGNRSIAAASRLKKIGFTVANMNGGIAAWNFSGLK